MNLNKKTRRILAAIIDLAIIFLIIYASAVVENNFTKFANIPVSSSIIYSAFYGYFILLEFFFKRTLGKRIFKIRINAHGKGIILFFKIILRNLFNPIEIVIPFIYLIPVIIWNKKLGEKVSKLDLSFE